MCPACWFCPIDSSRGCQSPGPAWATSVLLLTFCDLVKQPEKSKREPFVTMTMTGTVKFTSINTVLLGPRLTHSCPHWPRLLWLHHSPGAWKESVCPGKPKELTIFLTLEGIITGGHRVLRVEPRQTCWFPCNALLGLSTCWLPQETHLRFYYPFSHLLLLLFLQFISK